MRKNRYPSVIPCKRVGASGGRGSCRASCRRTIDEICTVFPRSLLAIRHIRQDQPARLGRSLALPFAEDSEQVSQPACSAIDSGRPKEAHHSSIRFSSSTNCVLSWNLR
jgi:hypothetical protein